jgi:GNAT superfamily N-acetyltransferase
MYPADRLLPDEIEVHRLDDSPPPDFDCGRVAQNVFLHRFARRDQQEWLSCTYLHYTKGICVAYATVCMDALALGTREKPKTITYKYVSALKLAQLGVDRRFQGLGLGREVIADVIALARDAATRYGCRYLTLDAQPDLVAWYKGHGFVINKLQQKQKIEAAAGRAGPEPLTVSMRFDLREV